jgi:Mg2+-importing ATPase
LSIVFKHNGDHLMITKGALQNILDACSSAETKDGSIVTISSVYNQIQKSFEEFSHKGFRTLGVAYKKMGSDSLINKENESEMIFSGFITLFDPPWCFIENNYRR